MSEATVSDLERFRWRARGQPVFVQIYFARSIRLPQSIKALDPDDPTGGRALLRSAAADLLEIPAAEVVLHEPRARARGLGRVRPGYAVAGGTGRRSLLRRRAWVSLARTADAVAVAVGTRRIGIDIESVQTSIQAEQLARVLHLQDRFELSRIRLKRLPAEVTGAWTRIEAYVKFRGSGLDIDPADIRVGTSAQPVVPVPARVLTVGIDEIGLPVEATASETAKLCLSLVW